MTDLLDSTNQASSIDSNETISVNINEEISLQNTESVIFVDADATEGENNGTSWANAYTDLQSALAAGGASNQIWVAEGTYFPTTDVDREISFVINNGVDVYGGFIGGETSLEQRDWEVNETILSGNIGESGQTDNSYNVVDITDSPANTNIDGFTITGGQADVDSFERTDRGGGLIGRNNAGATLKNLNIQNNFAANNGGGIYLEKDTSVTIDSTIFTDNSSGGDGGAVYVGGDNSLNIFNSSFLNNQSAGGGAIHINSIDTLNVVNSTFYNNQGGEADDIYDGSFAPSNRTISNNIFSDDQPIDRAKIFFDVRLSSTNVNFSNNIIDGIALLDEDISEFGTENTIEDPLFTNPENNNFRLQVDSPGIDAGNNDFISNASNVTDIANNPRIYNEIVDIGAYEYGLYLSINDVIIQEGNEGTTNAEFTVTLLDTLGQPATSEIVVSYGTANDTAESNSDFESTSGTLIFAPGETEKTVTVAVNGDTEPENDESFFINLANPTGAAVIGDSQGRGLIQDEDVVAQGATVYRFFETNGQTQFYTTSELERDTVIETLTNYEYQGESFIGAPNPEENNITGVTPVYRLFNKDTGVHLYTASEVERDFVVENLTNYIPEGVSYYGYESQQEGTVPLYRFYNQSLDAHFYTPSAQERDEFLASPDYQLEGDSGIAFYVEPIV